MVNKV